MATFNLDLENGDDTKDGTTFANRWKTVASGATAARIAPGDTIKIMGSPAPTLVDSSASWTQNSATVTLSGAVTANISTCESAWTASANVTSTAATGSGDFKEGTHGAKHVIASAFTTGLASFFATGTLDLSAYQQVSFWIANSIAVAASTLSLRLCSDTAGVTTVHTIAIPALVAFSSTWQRVTVDLGSNMNASIKSVALYCDLDPGTITVWLDNIIACKASSSADSLTLTSLLGKKWNLSWAASTTYAQNDIIKPTQPNRNGLCYKNTTSGSHSSGGSEPTWPTEIGTTVVDSGVTWQCTDVEDTWYSIASINGTTVKLDQAPITVVASQKGYSGATESVATYKQETIKFTEVSAAATKIQSVQDSGTVGSPITFSGGWDRSGMTLQNLETWASGQNGAGAGFATNAKTFITFNNLNAVNCDIGILADANGFVATNCHSNNNNTAGFRQNLPGATSITGMVCNNNASIGVSNNDQNFVYAQRVRMDSNSTDGFYGGAGNYFANWTFVEGRAKNNGSYGFAIDQMLAPLTLFNVITGNNGTAAIFGSAQNVYATNCSFPEATQVSAQTAFVNAKLYSRKDGQVAGAYKTTTDSGNIQADASTRHTASGVAWRFNTTGVNRSAAYPLVQSLGGVAIKANTATAISIWTRRDATNQTGQLRVRGGQALGIPDDVTINSTPSINTWTQTGNITVTPTEDCVIELEFLVWTTSASSENYWCDDITVT